MNRLQTKDNVPAVRHLPAVFGATVLVPLLTGLSLSVALFVATVVGVVMNLIISERKNND